MIFDNVRMRRLLFLSWRVHDYIAHHMRTQGLKVCKHFRVPVREGVHSYQPLGNCDGSQAEMPAPSDMYDCSMPNHMCVRPVYPR